MTRSLLSVMLLGLFFCMGCEAKQQELTEEQEQWSHEAEEVADEMFGMRESEDLEDWELEQMEELYKIYELKNETMTKWTTHLDFETMRQMQRTIGGIEEYELVGTKVFPRERFTHAPGNDVVLTYNVVGPKGEAKETVVLWKADGESNDRQAVNLASNNNDQFIIIKHSQR